MLTDRLQRLKNRLFEIDYYEKKEWHFKGVSIVTDENRSEPLIVRKALAVKYMAEHLPAIIKKDELIVGNPNMNSVGFGTVIPNYATPEESAMAEKLLLDINSVWGHHPPGYEKIVAKGVANLQSEINSKLRETNDDETISLYRAMQISLDALILFAHRHSQAARRAAEQEADPTRRKELENIADICARVPNCPARSYQEALQSYWFVYCLINSGGAYVPLGCFDQIVGDCYQKDLDAQSLSRQEAMDLTGSFLIKCNERIQMNIRESENHNTLGMFSQGSRMALSKGEADDWAIFGQQRKRMWRDDEPDNSDSNYNFGQSGNDWLMNMMVGGFCEELGILVMDLMHHMDLLMPTLGARVSKCSSQRYLRKIAEVLRYGQGEPMIYNDDTIIPGLLDMGVSEKDAKTYSNDGCWEVLVPGKTYFSYCHIHNLQCIEWVFNRGVSMLDPTKKEGIDTGDINDFRSFEDFYAAYERQTAHLIDKLIRKRLGNFQLSSIIAPDPLASAITDDCLEKGKDITQDGCRYIQHALLMTGLTNAADSMAVIKKLVFEEQSATLSQLKSAMEHNWQGYELLRQKALNRVPKLGNDDDYVDDLAIRMMQSFEKQVQTYRDKHPKIKFPCGVGTFENYAVLGRDIAASADGRLAREALAPNYSPTPGMDTHGPTAVIRSMTKPDLLKYYCGCPLDISILAGEFEGEAGIERLKALIESYCEMGGQILTITSMKVEDLKDARIHPEKHQSIRVRMGGLSAYFVAMAPEQQDNIIKRFTKGEY
ncbi:MAG: pyruvate-formate lyase [Lachnospiraceae bacterium]|nr:pyruvate-formate lyase [Lachnospiraceae bacterium]